MTKAYCLNAKFTVLPERKDEFLSIIQNDKKMTLDTEPLALQFVVGEDTERPGTFHLHEQYIGERGFQQHIETKHFAEWNKFCESKPFTEDGEPEVQFFTGEHAPQKIASRKAFCLNVEICPTNDVLPEFKSVIENNAKGSTEDEVLCLQYNWGESTTDPGAFYFHEQYTGDDDGKEGFDTHAKTPHFDVWDKFAAKNPFAKPPVVSFYRTL